MNIIYIHGLMAVPSPDKMNILSKYASNLLAPQIDYLNNDKVFLDLLAMGNQQKIDVIVGSSAGGLMGYWLAKHWGCKALLFNPALAKLPQYKQRTDIFAPPVVNFGDIVAPYHIVLGALDEVVLPNETIDFLTKNENPAHYTLEKIDTLAHRIPLEVFEGVTKRYFEERSR